LFKPIGGCRRSVWGGVIVRVFGYASTRMAAIDLYRALWRRRYMIIALTALITVTAWARSSAEPKVYKASALVRIQQTITDPTQAGSALGVSQHLALTYAQIVGAYSIGNRVYRQLDGRVPRDEISITGEPVENLELLYISATAHDPREAAEVANAAPVVLRKFVADAGTLSDQIVTINPAGVPTTAMSPHPTRVAILALLIGLVINGAFALLLEFLADRLPDLDEVEATLGKPVLATVPKVSLQPGNVEELKRLTPARTSVWSAGSPREAGGAGQTRVDPRVG
jgi:capsular polysaccharide biosynthesis protein